MKGEEKLINEGFPLFRGVNEVIDPAEKGVILDVTFLPSKSADDKQEVGQSDRKDNGQYRRQRVQRFRWRGGGT